MTEKMTMVFIVTEFGLGVGVNLRLINLNFFIGMMSLITLRYSAWCCPRVFLLLFFCSVLINKFQVAAT